MITAAELIIPIILLNSFKIYPILFYIKPLLLRLIHDSFEI